MTKEETITEAKRLYTEEGLSAPLIAEALGISTSNIYYWLNAGLKIKSHTETVTPEQIAARKEKKRILHKKYKKAHGEQIRAYAREYYHKHKNALREGHKKWYLSVKDTPEWKAKRVAYDAKRALQRKERIANLRNKFSADITEFKNTYGRE